MNSNIIFIYFMYILFLNPVILDATSTTTVEVASVVERYLSKSNIYHQGHDMYIILCIIASISLSHFNILLSFIVFCCLFNTN